MLQSTSPLNKDGPKKMALYERPLYFDTLEYQFSQTVVRVYYLRVANYALSKNRIPVVHALEIFRVDPETGVELDELSRAAKDSDEGKRYEELKKRRKAHSVKLNLNAHFNRAPLFDANFSLELSEHRNGEIVGVDARQSRIRPELLENLHEVEDVPLRVRVEPGDPADGETVESEEELELLPPNMARVDPAYFQSFVSFIRPSDPELLSVLSDTSDLLKELTGDGGLYGYQKGTDDAIAIAKAAYLALQRQNIRYIAPPHPLIGASQAIRTNSEVLQHRFGTCIDLALLYAAVLEQCDLHPVVIITRNHAVVGLMLEPALLRVPVIMDPREAMNYMAARLIMPIDVEFISPASFEEAVESGENHTYYEKINGIVGVVDARREGIRPLIMPWERDTYGVTGDAPAGAGDDPQSAALGTTEISAARDTSILDRFSSKHQQGQAEAKNLDTSDSSPVRIQRWKAELLDLSKRNRLLNLRPSADVLDLLFPASGLPVLDDKIHSNEQLSLHSKEDVSTNRRLQGIYSIGQVDPDAVTAELSDRNRLYVNVTDQAYKSRFRKLFRKAKTLLEETGTSCLYLTLGAMRLDDGQRAPLFLIPVRIVMGKGDAPNRLQVDSTQVASPNYCLVEYLKQKHNLTIEALSSPCLDEAGLDIDYAFEHISRALVDAELPFVVTEESTLAIARFTTYGMWKDLEQSYEDFMDSPVFHHLTLKAGQSFVDPAGDADLRDIDFDESSLALPIAADGAQMRAIAAAGQGRSFVLEGPPGTGKSQTITNLIAHCLDLGKTVLFVAEKQAALQVVKRRLHAAGLSNFTLDLHGSDLKPAEIRRQIRNAIDAEVHYDQTTWDTAVARFKAAMAPLKEYPQQVHSVNSVGYSLWSAASTLIDLGPDVTAPIPQRFITDNRGLNVEDLKDAARGLTLRVAQTDEQSRHTWSGLGAELGGNDLERSQAWQELDQAYRTIVSDDQLRAALLAMASPAKLQAQVAVLEEAADGSWPVVEQLREVPNRIAEMDALAAEIRSFVEGYGFQRSIFTPSFLSNGDIDQLQQVADAAEGGVFGKKKRRQQYFQQLQVATNQQVWGDLERDPMFGPDRIRPLLEQVRAARHTEAQLNQRIATVTGSAEFANCSVFDSSILQRMYQHRENLRQQHEAYQAMPELVGAIASGAMSKRDVIAVLVHAADAWQRWCAALGMDAEANDFQFWFDRHEAWATSLEEHGFGVIAEVHNFTRYSQPLEQAGLGQLVQDISAGRFNSSTIDMALLRGIANAALDERILATGLASFNRENKQAELNALNDAIAKLREEAKIALPARLLQRRPFTPGRLDASTAELRRALDAKRNVRSFRSLLEQYGDEIMAVAPCFLVSPSSLADYVSPASVKFDVVVFDEASQVTVDQAVGALGRGRSAVIVGDDKQMPPTRVGKANLQTDEDLEDAVEAAGVGAGVGAGAGAEDDATFNMAGVGDMESILTECAESGLPRIRLNWHYRSQDEALIAFSNYRYYEGDLASLPAPGHLTTAGLYFRRVDGQFIRDAKDRELVAKAESAKAAAVETSESGTKRNSKVALRTNPVEARAIVEEITRRVNDPLTAQESIGVVTFNIQQRDLILDLLEESTDPLVTAALERLDDPIFVKNLENVQGDERDTILFSASFSKRPDGDRLPLNFGPLTAQGGERRLNVAITRARTTVVVFASFDPRDIDLSRTSNQGMADLREYLLLAESQSAAGTSEGSSEGTSALAPNRANQLAVSIDADRVRDTIAEDLAAMGWHVETNYGLSTFRIDIVARPHNDSRWHCAILLDGPSWAEWETVADRDLTPGLLSTLMHWVRVERLWLPDFIGDREDMIQRLHHALLAAGQEIAADDARRRELNEARQASLERMREQGKQRREAQQAAREEAVAEQADADGDAPVDEVAAQQRAAELLSDGLDDGARVAADVAAEPADEVEAVSWNAEPEVDPAAAVAGGAAVAGAAAAENATFVMSVEHTEITPQILGEPEDLTAGVSDETVQKIQQLIEQITETSAPIELQRLRISIVQHFGFKRTGKKLVEIVDQVIPKQLIHTEADGGAFVWADGVAPDSWRTYRTFPKPRAAEISLHEIAVALWAAWTNLDLPEPLGTSTDQLSEESRNELILAAADLLGFRRKSELLKKRIGDAIPLLDSLAQAYQSGETVSAKPVFAVLDVETTGFSTSDRILELGVVLADASGAVVERWDTLLNPNRHFDNEDVHGIYPQDLVGAPTFEQVAPELLRLLDGTILVAHNASFDCRMLSQEFARAGIEASATELLGSSVCTMRLTSLNYPAAGKKLDKVLDYFGLQNSQAHSALDDAEATAKLLQRLLADSALRESVLNHHSCNCGEVGAGAGARAGAVTGAATSDPVTVQLVHRSDLAPKDGTNATGALSWLNSLAESLPADHDPDLDEYISELDKAMVDCHLSATESKTLHEIAQRNGLRASDVQQVHRNYVRRLAVLALADRIVTDDERRQLNQAAEILNVPLAEVDQLLAEVDVTGAEEEVQQLVLEPGQRITFTGATEVPRKVWEERAKAAGLTVAGMAKAGVALVAANPDSTSGKARRARELGIPVITESYFATLLRALEER